MYSRHNERESVVVERLCRTLKNTIYKHVFVIKKVKNTVPSTYVSHDLNGEEVFWTFYKKELQKK